MTVTPGPAAGGPATARVPLGRRVARAVAERRAAFRPAPSAPADDPIAADPITGADQLAATRPAGSRLPDRSFEERMATVEFRVAEEAHIVVDGDVCRSCTTKACVTACPANLFVPTAEGGVLFNYEQCFECGTCYMVCNHEGAIRWRYPLGGHGVVLRSS